MDPIATIRIKHAVQVLTTMLVDILRNTGSRTECVVNFQKEVWNLDASSDDFPELRVLRDLALELDYYKPDPAGRQQDGSYGDEPLEAKIDAAIRKLTEPNGSAA
jgi:hypothetical protein